MPVDVPTRVEARDAGAVLRAAREAAGLSVPEAAQRLKLTVRLVEAIEANDRQRFPPAVYLRGFVRNYAKLLGLDADPLVAAFDREQPAAQQGVETAGSGDRKPPESFGWLRVGDYPPLAVATAAVCLMVGVLVVLMVWLWAADRDLDSTPAEAAATATEAPSVTEGQPAVEVTGASPGAGGAVDSAVPETVPDESAGAPGVEPAAGQVGVETPVDMPAPEADRAAAPEGELAEGVDDATALVAPEPVAMDAREVGDGAAAAGFDSPPDDGADPAGTGDELPIVHRLTPTGDEELRFEFTEDCWVEVFDTEGGILYQELMRQRQSLSLVGAGPFQIRLGYAPGVTLQYNGEPVPLAPHTRNNVALLVVGQ